MYPKPTLGPGLCQCGCGQITTICKQSKASRGDVIGEHARFALGHTSHKGPVGFWSHVPDHLSPNVCWEWTGTLRKGYGHFRGSAHRHIYEYYFGAIPQGLHVLHRCDNPPCVNPAHLFLGTNADNVADMNAKGRGSAKLSSTQREQIRTLYAAGGWTHRALARRFGVASSTIGWNVRR